MLNMMLFITNGWGQDESLEPIVSKDKEEQETDLDGRIVIEVVSFNAQELIDKLHEANVRLYEECLDSISNQVARTERKLDVGNPNWERDDDGNMILLIVDPRFPEELAPR